MLQFKVVDLVPNPQLAELSARVQKVLIGKRGVHGIGVVRTKSYLVLES